MFILSKFLLLRMKISICCTTTYYLTVALTIIRQTEAISDGDSSSSFTIPEKTCEARLDRVERKLEFQTKEMNQLRQDHEELKTIYCTLKKNQRVEEDSDEVEIKKDSTTTALISKTTENYYDHQIRMKRPARLLPASLFRSVRKNTTEEGLFNDPPTNCRDLSEIGYTLNGYYPVQLKLDGEQQSNKIGMIYCKFNSDKIAERKVGYLTVKSSPIHFYVMISKPFKGENRVIRPYEIELLNQGGAMNRTSGVFKAPVNGIYYFSFRGLLQSHSPIGWNFVHLRKNNSIVATSISSFGGWHTVSLECTIRLKKYDHIDVKKGKNMGELGEDIKEHLTHFSGHLLEEDLTL